MNNFQVLLSCRGVYRTVDTMIAETKLVAMEFLESKKVDESKLLPHMVFFDTLDYRKSDATNRMKVF